MFKKNLTLIPLERYKQRYTEQLVDWETQAFGEMFNVTKIEPDIKQEVLDINNGSVLDCVKRPTWCMAQISHLINNTPGGDLGNVYFSDFYTTGLDALAYANMRGNLYSFCWANTFDRYDFTQKHINWMRPWEAAAFEIYKGVFVACDGLRELIVTALPHVAHKVHVMGLPFDSKAVRDMIDLTFIKDEYFDCVYSSRWDQEKNPNFFLDLVESCPNQKFAVCTGWGELRGTDRTAIQRAQWIAEERNNLTIFKGVTKGQYYSVLAHSKVQFNCALQDWVSFTLLEALTFGCAPLYPNFRSFPETLEYSSNHLYRPNDIVSARAKFIDLLDDPYFELRDYILAHHDSTLARIAKTIYYTGN